MSHARPCSADAFNSSITCIRSNLVRKLLFHSFFCGEIRSNKGLYMMSPYYVSHRKTIREIGCRTGVFAHYFFFFPFTIRQWNELDACVVDLPADGFFHSPLQDVPYSWMRTLCWSNVFHFFRVCSALILFISFHPRTILPTWAMPVAPINE